MRSLFFLLVLIYGSHLWGQKVIVKKRSVSPATETVEEKLEDDEMTNLAVKYNIATAFIGEFPVSVEYAFADWFTAEAGVGLLTKNYLGQILSDSDFELMDEYGRVFSCPICEYSYSNSMSFLVKAKFFIDEDYFDGAYWSVAYNFRPYSGSSILEDNSTIDWKVAYSDFSLNRGWQYDNGNHLLFDIYYGVVLRMAKSTGPTEVYDWNTDTYYVEETTEMDNLLWVNFGLQLGYIFD